MGPARRRVLPVQMCTRRGDKLHALEMTSCVPPPPNQCSQLAYRTGDTRKAEQIRARLEPDDPLNPKAQGVRAPATGT